MGPPQGNAQAGKAPLPALKDTGNGLTVFYRGRYLYSRKFPQKTAEEAASSAAILPGTLVLAFSPLLGYGLRALLKRLPEDSFVLAVESDKALFGLSAGFVGRQAGMEAPPSGGARFASIFAESPEQVVRFIDGELLAIARPFRRYLRVDLSAGVSLESAFYSRAESLVSDYISSFWKNRATLIRLGRKYAENIFKNLGEIAAGNALGLWQEDGGSPSARAAARPIVVAGAGPSLDGAIGFIRRNRERVFLVAVDAALPALRAAGIAPDLAVTVEAQVWIGSTFCGSAPGKSLEAPLLADFASFPKGRGKKKRCAFILTRYAKSRFLERLSRAGIAAIEAPPLGSVGLSALYAARLLRSEAEPMPPVFFAGLEFSWGQGFSHAKGTAQVLEIHAASTRLSTAETRRAEGNAESKPALQGQGGAPLRTSDVMLRYAGLCAAFFSSGGFYRLGSCGLPQDFPSISLEAAEREIAAFCENSAPLPKERGLQGLALAGNAGENARKAALKFLQSEEKLLLELRALLALGRGGGDSGNTLRLDGLIRQVDYLYLHFPDYESELSVDVRRQDFLGRARVEAGFFLKTIQAALRQAGAR